MCKSVAKVEPISGASTIVKKRSPTSRLSKGRFQVKDLPSVGIDPDTWTLIKAFSMDNAAAQKPWARVSNDDFAALVNKACRQTNIAARVSSNSERGSRYETFLKIQGLVSV